ncbi:MAG: polyprenyl diphosphate synthase [Nanoarchaeota archaeon]|nr:polyprenyl diphosphate synthase [Nanoarchaeota archaeon]
MEPTISTVPKHIGIILDGNRRFAKQLMAKPWKGHEWGADKLEHVFAWCRDYGIKELTLYVLSIENFNRPKEEFDYLMDTFRKGFDKLLKDPRLKENVKLRFIGRLHMLPQDVQERMQELTEKTKNNTQYIINFAIAYGGRAEVVDAVQKLAQDVQAGKIQPAQINEESIGQHLYMQDEPDLIIRTGGEKRLSNFLLWQNSYTELIFLDILWPEFSKEDFVKCLEDYSQRKRRFGK